MRDAMLALFGAFTLVACSYDWSVAATVTADAGPDTTSALDGTAEADAVTAPESSPPDGPLDVTVEAPTSCTTLEEAQVQQARAKAIGCVSNTTACMTTVTDECGCTVVVYAPAPNSTATQDYLDAIAQMANCLPQCPGCGPAPTEGICLVSDASTTGYACYQ